MSHITTDDSELDEIIDHTLIRHRKMLNGQIPADLLYISDPDLDPVYVIKSQAKAAILDKYVLKSEVEAAMPKKDNETEDWTDRNDSAQAFKTGQAIGRNQAIDDYEKNLLSAFKQLSESSDE